MLVNLPQALIESYAPFRPDGRFVDRNRENLRRYRRSLADQPNVGGCSPSRPRASTLWLAVLSAAKRLHLGMS